MPTYILNQTPIFKVKIFVKRKQKLRLRYKITYLLQTSKKNLLELQNCVQTGTYYTAIREISRKKHSEKKIIKNESNNEYVC